MAWNNASAYGNAMNNNMPMNGYVPTYPPYTSYPNPQQNQFNSQPQPQTQLMSQNMGIQGRMVTSREEALGVPVDFSGAPMFFPDMSHEVIYCKKFNLGTGAADFEEYQRVPPQPQNSNEINMNMPKTNFASLEDFQTLNDMVSEMQNTIDSLQKEIDRLKKPINSTGKAVSKNESSSK